MLDYRLRTSALVLPVHPVHIMNFEVPGNGCANCRKEVLFAELCEQSESFQLVLYGIFELGKAKLATASRARSLNNSALAKNKGASHRNRTNPGIRRASGYRVMS